jgi:hypothetical protein
MSTAPETTSALALLLQSDAPARQLARGWVAGVEADGTVDVHTHASGEGMVVPCDRLIVAEGAELRLARGDVVLYWEPAARGDRGVVIGRIGASHGAPMAVAPAAVRRDEQPVPDELVLQARESLTLRVGDGSITLRADGRVTIKGRDLVSHAERLNRIKGGAVSIN